MEFIKNFLLFSNKYKKEFLADIYYQKNKKPKPVVIFSHGFKSFKDWGTFNLIAEYFAGKGLVFIKFNFPFNGTTIEKPYLITDDESFRKNSYMTELDNLHEMVDWVFEQNVVSDQEINKGEIYLAGHSRGAVISLLEASADSRVKKVCTWAAFSQLNKVLEKYDLNKWEKEGVCYTLDRIQNRYLPMNYSLFKEFLENRDLLDIQRVVQNLKIPVMVIHGTEDEIIPYEDALKLKEWNVNIELDILPLANHLFGSYHSYLKKTLPFDTQFAVDDTVKFFLKK